MKITERIEQIEGVESAFWDNQRSRLVVYHRLPTAIDTLKIKVSKAVDDAFLHNAIEGVTFISL